MKLYEYQGKELLKKYGIAVPDSILLHHKKEKIPVALPLVVKSQTLSGDRLKAGGIYFASSRRELNRGLQFLGKRINGEEVKSLLIEERIKATKEYYVSFSYDGAARGPVLAVNAKGGTGIEDAHIVPIDLTLGLPAFFVREALMEAKFPREDINNFSSVIQKLWEVFTKEYALLVEINPLFKTKDASFVAGDAKIILDDEKINPNERHYIEMDGDIAILASGGGASMLNMDALLHAGGRPANYAEYSGNPTADVVKELTKKVLSKPGLKGAWVVGAAANFTDIYVTLSGLLDGLREIKPKPKYPIVIRRDGPRREEAFKMLKKVGRKEGFDFHLYKETTPMIATAEIITRLAYKKK